MGLQDSFSRVEVVVPFGFIQPPKPKRKNPFTNANRVSKKGRGFASMEDGRRKKINARGGVNAHRNPKHLRCCEFTSETGRKAALKRWGKAR